MSAPFLIIPCSGIGKPFGTISREATYLVVENLRKGTTETICLSLLVTGDEDAKRQVKSHKCIAIDGCPNECAKKNLELSDAKLVANFRVVDVIKENRNLRPKEVTYLDKDGQELAGIVAEKVASKIDELRFRSVVS
jgi:uncharacterized metal-binding protein